MMIGYEYRCIICDLIASNPDYIPFHFEYYHQIKDFKEINELVISIKCANIFTLGSKEHDRIYLGKPINGLII